MTTISSVKTEINNRYWITCAITAGICMGTGNFIYASNYSYLGFQGNGLLGPGALLVFSIVKFIREYTHFKREGRWFKANNSAWIDQNGAVYYKNFVPLLVNGLTGFGFSVVMTFAWRFAKMGGMNQGIISTLLSFSSLFNVFLFAKIFGEKVTKYQLFGILLMITAVCCFSI